MSDIREWLERYGLGEYAGLFAEQRIEKDVLAELTDADLKDFGVPFGDRKRLLHAIAASETTALDEMSQDGSASGTTPSKNEAERRQLTVMFADLVGSTELSQRLDPEDLRAINRAYQDAAKGAIEQFDGYIARYMGDGVLAYFGYPYAHEDDAERSIRAGLELLKHVPRLDPELKLAVRIGIATGPVVVGDIIGEHASQERAVVGKTPNLAARLQSVAASGTVVIDATTSDLVGETFELTGPDVRRVKGFEQPLSIRSVLAERAVESRFEARGGTWTELVGRDHELGLLLERWETVKTGEGQTVLIFGEAGIGKSRIIEAFLERTEEQASPLVRYQCSPFHTGAALYPIVQQLERDIGLEARESWESKLDKLEEHLTRAEQERADIHALMAALLSLPFEERYGPLHLTPEVRRLRTIELLSARLQDLACRQPVRLILEDAQWVDPTTHEFLAEVVGGISARPVMILITHRPEWRPMFLNQPNVIPMGLARLAHSQSGLLVRQVAARALSDEIVRQIVERTSGVPLFIEELTKSLVEKGGTSDSSDIPPTLQSSLMARLDRLHSAKEVIQAAAVVGREFQPTILGAILDMSEVALSDALKRLVDSELVYSKGLGAEQSLVFKHNLIQDVAYESILRQRRQELHGRVADYLQQSDELDDLNTATAGVLAHHLRRAGRHWDAARYSSAAARISFEGASTREAVLHAERALADLQALEISTETKYAEAALNNLIGEVLVAAEGFSHSDVKDRFERALALAIDSGDLDQEFSALLGLAPFLLSTRGGDSLLPAASRMLEIAELQSDDDKKAVSLNESGVANFLIGNFQVACADMENAWSLATGHSRGARTMGGADFRIHLAGYMAFLNTLLCQPDKALEICERATAIAESHGHPFSRAWALAVTARVLIYCGEYKKASMRLGEALRICEEHGFHQRKGNVLGLQGRLKCIISDGQEGLQDLQQGLELWRAPGTSHHATEYLCYIAEAHLNRGEVRLGENALLEAGGLAELHGEWFFRGEQLRLQGLCLSARGEVEQSLSVLRAAVAASRDQGARLFWLRAARDFASGSAAGGPLEYATALLREATTACSNAIQLPELNEANALLDRLSA